MHLSLIVLRSNDPVDFAEFYKEAGISMSTIGMEMDPCITSDIVIGGILKGEALPAMACPSFC
jgi:hypothetical protein